MRKRFGIGTQLTVKIIHTSNGLSRIIEINLNGKTLLTPAYFPSISSYGIKLPLSYLVYLLANYSYRHLLVSAYDIWHEKTKESNLMSSIERYNQTVRKKNDGFLFLDSGNYESFWYQNSNWDFNSYKEVICSTDFDFYSSYDVIPKKEELDEERLTTQTFSRIIQSSALSNKGQLMSLLHGRSPEHLLNILKKFLDSYPDLCTIIGIPERDCGNGILERAQTVIEIRKLLDRYDERYILHLLGCGDPLSTLLYAYCGADTFDSLDWYEHAFDPKTLMLRDLAHFELFNCKCKACNFLEERSKVKKVIAFDKYVIHNLFNYQDHMTNIQSSIRNDRLFDVVRTYFGNDIQNKLK